ncbi:Lrp/AsnC family transcriptional regulator [Streptomonospora wellingtoniae]|uniref:Lrp/AsnC family transcriptional regulator n=1 Tax=Streptomonospora wellingtoniae TaxID=3075544 RepID=A0ABU2KY71_9ACTN|nr:Lrp/AsnC family transcriptional regulator [Streptomonospora sp. DSM 45055]MDT0304247.1 Lrp/AsnC family transcriptional regulator [Streptomonospora sp. DSM 45055]
MQEYASLDELDLSIVSALQLEPRGTWSRIGSALGVDAVTVARRWAQMADSGSAWITCSPGPSQYTVLCTAFIDVQCEAGRTSEVAAAVSAMAQVATVEHVSGNRDLYLTVFVPDLAALSGFLLDVLAGLPGVRETRTQIATRVYAEGSGWDLRALDSQQRAKMEESGTSKASTVNSRYSLTDRDRELAARLSYNGRESYTDLAAHLGVGVSTVRRWLRHLIVDGHLSIRCEIARPLSDWPVSASVWSDVAAGDLDRVAQLVASLAETRMCMTLTGGPANLLFSVWLRTAGDLQRLEMELARRVPAMTIVDRAVAFRHIKRMGRLLDREERSIGTVPVDAWDVPAAPAPPRV